MSKVEWIAEFRVLLQPHGAAHMRLHLLLAYLLLVSTIYRTNLDITQRFLT